jgi:hypothetical protein
MQSNGRRLAWIALFVLLLVVVGAVGYRLGIAHGGIVNAAAVRGFGFRSPGIGLLGLLGPLVLVGLAVTFVVLLVREPARPPPRPNRAMAAMASTGSGSSPRCTHRAS